jgi:hypothetical protein
MIEYCFKIGAMNKEQTDEVDLKMDVNGKRWYEFTNRGPKAIENAPEINMDERDKTEFVWTHYGIN